MKRVILIATAIGMMLFCMCAVAHAESFKGKCSEAPYSVTGEVEIEESGACKISHGITATGYIKIKATGAVTIEGTVDAGYGFGVTTSGNLEVTGDVATNTAGDGGNVWIKAEGEVATGSITTGGGAHAGSVQIKANQGGGSHLFTIGGSGNSNGVNGSINTSGTTAGATESIYVQDGITIENGTTSSTGGITLEAMSDLNVIQSASRSGAIVLQAQNGVLKLPSGHLSANGDTGEGAGFVQLMAKEISVESGAEITAIQEESAAATCHNVILAASTVKHGSSKLELRADGKGYEKACGGAVELVPQGAIAITYLGSNEVTYWEERTVGESSSNSLSLEGTGELVITADGKKDTVEIWGNPLKMHKTKIFAAGSENEVFIYSGTGWSSPTYNKLTFAEPVEVFASTEEKGATTNKIYVRGSEIAKPEGHVELDAAGLKGANGGTVQLVSEKGEVYLGESSSTITLNVSAFDGEGSGGTATVDAGKSTVKIAENAFFGSTFEGNSSGGALEVYGGKIESTKANVALFATGHGSGKDGRIKLQSEGKLAIGGSSGELELVLAGEATGGAGTAELSGSEVEVNGGYIFDTPDTAGNGAEVKVYDTGTLKVSNEFELKANAGPDKGNGGVIDLKADDIEVTGPYSATISADGTENGEGGHLLFEADGIEMKETTVGANAAGTGHGGEIKLDSEGDITISGTLEANADPSGDGDGGLIEIESVDEVNLEEEKVDAEGSDSDEGGKVTVSNPSEFDVDRVINVSAGLLASPGLDDGDISLHNTLCGGVLTGNTIWPDVYWDCANPHSASVMDAYPEEVATAALSTTLREAKGTGPIEIYVFETYENYNEYFKTSGANAANDKQTGLTWQDVDSAKTIYSSVWEKSPETGDEFSEATFKETTMHELGHAFDHLFGQKNQSGSTSKFNKYVEHDFANLDYASLGSTKDESVLRLPCEKTPIEGKPGEFYAGKPPFEGIARVCTGTTLNAEFSGLPNSQILQNEKVGKYWFTLHEQAGEFFWNELYAQAFAFVSYAAGAKKYAYEVPDLIFVNEYFPCTREWAHEVVEGNSKPSNTSCETVPGWYSL